MNPKVVLITGAARRIGATMARYLHGKGLNIIIHYHRSQGEAEILEQKLNALRPDSARIIMADLNQNESADYLISAALDCWQRLDVLINNASRFYSTEIGRVSEQEWDDLMASNLKAPFFLSQSAAPYLAEQKGCIINLVDTHLTHPLSGYSVYNIAKAGLAMLTKSLAKELGPRVRVNAIAPGAILWPEGDNELDEKMQQKIIEKTALKRSGSPEDVAKAAWFFIEDADFITGQILAVDGGRLLASIKQTRL